MKEHTLTLQVLSNKVQQIPTSIVQNDSDTNVILISLVDATNKPYSLGTITSIGCKVLKENGNIAILGTSNVITTDWANGKIKVTLPSLAVSQAGVCQAVIEFYDTGKRVTTARFSYLVTADIMGSANQQIDVDTAIQLTTLTQNAMGQFESFKTTAQAAEIMRVNNESTRVSSENTRVANESSRSSSESTRVSNEIARVNSESTRANAENTRISAESTRRNNEDARVIAETTRSANELDRVSSESTRANNENARIETELVRTQNESSRLLEESKRATSEYNRSQEELTRQGKEAERLADETQRVARENTRVANESDRVLSEDKRKENESARVTVENNRVNTEATRVSNENSRTAAETTRGNNETARINAESTRGSNESTRSSNESTRVSSETARTAAETTRKTNETARVSSETTRASNEAARVTAEASRVATFNEQVATITDKVQINGEATNVNFIRNDVVQSGLAKSYSGSVPVKTNTGITLASGTNYTIIMKCAMSGMTGVDNYIMGNQGSTTGFFIRKNSTNKLQINNVADNSVSTSIKDVPSVFDLILLIESYTTVKAYVNGELYCSLGNIKESVNPIALNASSIAWQDTVNYPKITDALIYNRTLTQQELQYNFNILNNSKSINRINDYYISTDTDHIQDRTGRTTEQINRVFYKQNCKEFTSSGGDITVNNGMDGYLLSGKIEGQTVKNFVPKRICDFTKMYGTAILTRDTINNTISSNASGDLALRETVNLEPLKKYTFITNILRNTLPSSTSVGLLLTNDNRPFPNSIYLPQGKTGILKTSFTTKATFTENYVSIFKNDLASGEFEIQGYLILEGDWTSVSDDILVKMCKGMDAGLNSTQATIYNNGLKYSFVKDGAVIELGGTATKKDTLEVKEDGSAIYTQNTKNNEDGSARVDLVTPVVTSIDKSLVPTVLTQLSNTFTFGDAVKPSKVIISVPVNKIADLETRLGQLESVVTSTSNLSLMANYVDDEYNNSLNQM